MSLKALHFNNPRGRIDFPFQYIYIDEHSPLYVMPLHWHKEWEFLHIVQGEFDLFVNAKELHISAGEFILLSEGTIHGCIPHNCIYEAIIFDPRILFHTQPLLRKLLKPNYNQQRVFPIIYPADDSSGIDLLTYFFFLLHNQGIGHEMEVFGTLCLILGRIERQNYWVPLETTSASSRKLAILKQCLDYIEEHYTQDLSLDSLAEQVGMTPRYFCRFFKEMTSKPPMEYLNAYRIEMASIDLLESKKSVTEIAYDNGFHDLNYFIRAFKKQKGLTPGQYMHQNAIPLAVELSPMMSNKPHDMFNFQKEILHSMYPKSSEKKTNFPNMPLED